jgi:DNA-binding transcriptional ArsR family regulator
MAKRKRPKQLEINDLETLKAITDPTRLAILESIAEARSVSEIAEVLGVPRTRLYHHIKVLEDSGVIRVASTRKKGALEEKLYEPAADSFVPGSRLMESENVGERVEAAVAGILDTTREDLRRSLLEQWSNEESARRAEVGMLRSLLRLTDEEAEQFSEEFQALLKKYGALHPQGEHAPGVKLHALTWLFYPSSRDNR